jgi:hypothetical protein
MHGTSPQGGAGKLSERFLLPNNAVELFRWSLVFERI